MFFPKLQVFHTNGDGFCTAALSDEGRRYFPAFCPLMVWRECAPFVT
jgi:hypothetical protein